MRKRRKNRFLRRLVLGLAVAAVAVPVAQAVPDEGGLQGNAGASASNGLPMRADDKAGIGLPNGLVAHPDNRADRPTPANNLADRPAPGYGPTVAAEYRQFEYRGMLPSDYGLPNGIVEYRGMLPSDYGQPNVIADPTVVVADRPDGFDWGDAGIGAGTLFAVVLLAVGGVLVTRHLNRAATA
jgi:hypothetical protein